MGPDIPASPSDQPIPSGIASEPCRCPILQDLMDRRTDREERSGSSLDESLATRGLPGGITAAPWRVPGYAVTVTGVHVLRFVTISSKELVGGCQYLWISNVVVKTSKRRNLNKVRNFGSGP